MRPLLLLALLPATALGCFEAEPPRAPRAVSFPVEAARVEGVCGGAATSRAISVSVEPRVTTGAPVGAPWSNGQRRFRIASADGATHDVRADYVVAESGRCDRAWARSTRLGLQDTKTCAPPHAASLAPDASMELRLLPHRERFPDACTKVGLALHAEVDGQPACFELGSWILYRDQKGEDD